MLRRAVLLPAALPAALAILLRCICCLQFPAHSLLLFKASWATTLYCNKILVQASRLPFHCCLLLLLLLRLCGRRLLLSICRSRPRLPPRLQALHHLDWQGKGWVDVCQPGAAHQGEARNAEEGVVNINLDMGSSANNTRVGGMHHWNSVCAVRHQQHGSAHP